MLEKRCLPPAGVAAAFAVWEEKRIGKLSINQAFITGSAHTYKKG